MFSIWGYYIFKKENENIKHLWINHLFLSTFSIVFWGWLDSKENTFILNLVPPQAQERYLFLWLSQYDTFHFLPTM